MDQIQNALKTVTDRMSQKSQAKDEDYEDGVTNSEGTARNSRSTQLKKSNRMKERIR